MLIEKLTGRFEQLLNRGIRGSTTAEKLCQQLDGRVLSVQLVGTGVTAEIRAADGKLFVRSGENEAADATISGGPLALQRLLSADPEAAIRDGSVKISGDSDIATAFRDLIRFASPDAEEELSHLVGDAAAHQLGNVVRELAGWAGRARHTIGRSAAEYLQEESRDLPAPAEVEEFCHQVDTLANDVARAEARIRKLQSRVSGD